MSTSLAIERTMSSASNRQWAFALSAIAIAVASCALAGFAPLGFSIIAVFLFAGPHNWLEARYMLTRMPARWGPLRPYFLLGMIGVPLLMGAFALMPWLLPKLGAGPEGWNIAVAAWNTALILWVVALIQLRSEQPPRRSWPWAWPIGLLLIAANWLWPVAGSFLLVYAHPLVALWFLDRELGRQRHEWQRAYRCCLALLPLLLGVLWWRLADTPDLAGNDVLTLQITNHAGAGVLQHVSTHLLVATHVFLEMLHYGVWVLAIPLVSIRTLPWRLDNVPLAHKSQFWRRLVLALLGLGVVVVLVLWGAFLADYPLTRDVYFTVALLHVLAEVPFLLRLL